MDGRADSVRGVLMEYEDGFALGGKSYSTMSTQTEPSGKVVIKTLYVNSPFW